MSASPKQHAIRRSTRLPLEVPILVTSLDPSFEFSEECITTLVNAHGCGLVVQRSFPRDLPVRLEIVRSKRHTTARVADVVPLGGEPETWLLGMELDTPGNFWGIEYAPSDWTVEENLAPPATSADADAPKPAPETVAQTPRRWRLTDITADACYLEAGTPFPISTQVLLSVRVADFECVLEGVVRASYPESGMGVEFVSDGHQHRARAAELIDRLVTHREVPRVFVGRKEKENTHQASSKGQATAMSSPDQPDPLLDLIRKGDSLPLDEFQNRLRAQRSGHPQPKP